MNILEIENVSSRSEVRALLQKGTRTIAPLWSLENFVAVNPYLGMSDIPFEQAMEFLNRCSGAEATLPLAFYRNALESGRLTKKDITNALEAHNGDFEETADDFIAKVMEDDNELASFRVSTLADVASEVNGKKWRRFMIDRISMWASAYFDEKQAIWKTTRSSESLFKAWKDDASIDFSTEAMGLKGFRKMVRTLPDDYVEAASMALNKLEVPTEMTEHYLSSLLLKMNGWAGFAARIDWDASLQGEESECLEEFLTILLVWEMCLSELLKYPELETQWRRRKSETLGMLATGNMDDRFSRRLILQCAFDFANQRKVISSINSVQAEPAQTTPDAQAVFCIDVRSEVMRRNLEAAHPDIETLGFAGFFGFPIKYQALGHDEGTSQCPVLLPTAYTVTERISDERENQKAIESRALHAQLNKVWKSFKSSAISCFSFVSPLGIFFLPKLLTDAHGLTRPVPRPERAGLTKRHHEQREVELEGLEFGVKQTGIPVKDRVRMAASVLKGMSLAENFAPIVLLVGHGANTTNNPHATGLDCGACGGHTGEANVKTAVAILNDKVVREGLVELGIEIPKSTLFIAALHDTTTDRVTLFEKANLSTWHREKLGKLKESLNLAGEMCRKERGERMNVTGEDISDQVMQRSNDWSQVRPEWGLAGCSSFIVAPRARTKQLNLNSKAFMHSYDWKKDEGFGVLELIMTAPMVVTSWINLQYYASTVDNKRFGSGNKTLHNVVGGLGVLEGFAGDLRVGLPWQSVHDGSRFQHEPERLNVIIEAPVDEMSKILKKHDSIRQLVDNQWIFLFAMNEAGKVAYRYIGDLQWEVI